ncbi:hypothetical protein FRB95_007339 [Tulasnella sp. JGI-2019a]|nr:hypothetical protein FRB95_007339 [Tulasnella sp. JGI-2019a]
MGTWRADTRLKERRSPLAYGQFVHTCPPHPPISRPSYLISVAPKSMDHDTYAPTMSKLHPTLCIPEILLEILTRLSTTDLVRVAQTCKTWAEPALDIKWRTHRIKFSRLLSILAPLVNVNDNLTSLILPYEKMNQSLWTRFVDGFAGKVTWLELDIALDLVSIAHIEKLLARFGRPLCKNLTCIDAKPYPLSDSDGWYIPVLELLLRSDLVKVTLPSNATPKTTTAALSLLGHQAPCIRDLTVTSNETFNYAIFTNLRSFSHQGYLSLTNYTVLASLPHLQILHLFQNHISDARHNDGSIITFPSLHEFSMSEISAELEGAVEQSVMPALRTLRVTMTGDGRLTLLDHVLQASPLLEYLHLEVNAPARALKLRRHDQIRRLVLINYVWGAYGWNDDDLNWIGGSFPSLQDLAIHGGYHWRYQTTWRTLPSLVTQCSDNLRILEITLYVKSFTLTDVAPWDITLPSLTTLILSRLQIKEADVDPFSKYLAALCPNVKTLEIGEFYEILIPQLSKTGGRTKGQPRSRRFSEAEKDLFIGRFFECKAGRCAIEDVTGVV